MESRELPTGAGLAVRDVVVSFGGITALEQVSVDVSPGEVLGVIGPNGAGKTTLFNVICGFVRPNSGTLSWHGQPMTRVAPDRLASLGIARTLQGVGLFPGLTVLENVMVGAQRFRKSPILAAMLGLPWSDRDEGRQRDRAMAALERLGCDDVADRLPGTLPYAVQKRVALARALVSEPELLLLDEPAGGLDAREMSDLGKLIQSLGSSVAVMLVDHHMDFVVPVCDRVVVLDFGRVIADGEPTAVQRNPRVLEAYLGREAEDAEEPAPAQAPGPAPAPAPAPAPGREANVLTIEGLTTDYGPVRAVDHVSFEVPEGSVTAVLGANGAGKTSLLRTITGLVRPSSGSVKLFGEDITRLPVEEIVRRGMAHVPEGRGVIAELTVAENLRLGGLWRGRDAAPLKEIYDLFPRLEEREGQPASRLSGGERQMLSIGRALVGRPQALLLDEPSLGLAPVLVAQIMGLVRRLADSLGLAVLLVEQNARSALSIANRGVVLNLGRVVAEQDPDSLIADDRLLHAYLGF